MELPKLRVRHHPLLILWLSLNTYTILLIFVAVVKLFLLHFSYFMAANRYGWYSETCISIGGESWVRLILDWGSENTSESWIQLILAHLAMGLCNPGLRLSWINVLFWQNLSFRNVICWVIDIRPSVVVFQLPAYVSLGHDFMFVVAQGTCIFCTSCHSKSKLNNRALIFMQMFGWSKQYGG